MNHLPSYEEVEYASRDEINHLMDNLGIRTVYFAIDGTHRYAHSKLREKFNPQTYFDLMKNEFIRVTTTLIRNGFRNIIILLHDSSSFSRGKEYLEKAIKFGVEPLWDDTDYIKFYDREEIQVRFSGFNALYSEGGFPEVETKMDELEALTRNNSRVVLSFYSCFTPSRDVSELASISRVNNLENMKSQKEYLYGMDFPDIDLSLYYGKPRSKVAPLLIDDSSLKLYMREPSFTLNDLVIRRAIWYCILNRSSILDQYRDYRTLNQIMFNLPGVKYFWGEGSYVSDIYI